jgi:FKBP-type peptidyl-prolyl cis-trans isomerase
MTPRARSAHRAVRALYGALIVPLMAWSCARPGRPAPAQPTISTATPQRAVGDTVTTFTGIKYVVLQRGGGARPRAGRTVILHYTGTLKDGTKFDSSRDRAPFEFVLGSRSVIAGWEEVIGLLEIGDRAMRPASCAAAAGDQRASQPASTLPILFEIASGRSGL